MPARDEEKRMAFLRSLSVQDLANRRITEYSSETEKHMIHEAREMMKEQNDARYLKRHVARSKIDLQKATANDIRRRSMNELVGKEGGLTGGLVGQYMLPVLGVGGLGIAGAVATRGRGLGRINPFKRALTAKQSVELKGLAERIKSGGVPTRQERQFLDVLIERTKRGEISLTADQRKRVGQMRKALKNRELPSSPKASGSTAATGKLADLEKAMTELTTQNAKMKRKLGKMRKSKSGTQSPPKPTIATNVDATFDFNVPKQVPKPLLDSLAENRNGKLLTKITHKDDSALNELAEAIAKTAKDKTPEEADAIMFLLTDKAAQAQKLGSPDAYKNWATTLHEKVKGFYDTTVKKK